MVDARTGGMSAQNLGAKNSSEVVPWLWQLLNENELGLGSCAFEDGGG
jgi:hypothetical protein